MRQGGAVSRLWHGWRLLSGSLLCLLRRLAPPPPPTALCSCRLPSRCCSSAAILRHGLRGRRHRCLLYLYLAPAIAAAITAATAVCSAERRRRCLPLGIVVGEAQHDGALEDMLPQLDPGQGQQLAGGGILLVAAAVWAGGIGQYRRGRAGGR
jgi:hypothetical protein